MASYRSIANTVIMVARLFQWPDGQLCTVCVSVMEACGPASRFIRWERTSGRERVERGVRAAGLFTLTIVFNPLISALTTAATKHGRRRILDGC